MEYRVATTPEPETAWIIWTQKGRYLNKCGKEGAMKKLHTASSVRFTLILVVILFFTNVLFVSWPSSVLGWSEDDVNTVFKLAKHTPVNDYPGGGSQNSTEGFGYRVEGWSVEPRAGYIRLALMNRTDCPGQVAKFRLEWSFGKDIGILSGWTKKEATWKDRLLFTVTTRVLEDGGDNSCIRANPEIRVETGGAFYHAPSGPTYFDPKGHPDATPGQRNVRLGAPYYSEAQVKINIGSFPGMSQSALYTFQGFKEDRTSICMQYACTAATQNQENLNRKCGYSGVAWQSDYSYHFNWCMSADPSRLEVETQKRQEELNRCRPR